MFCIVGSLSHNIKVPSSLLTSHFMFLGSPIMSSTCFSEQIQLGPLSLYPLSWSRAPSVFIFLARPFMYLPALYLLCPLLRPIPL